MSMLDGEYRDSRSMADYDEPTDEELDAIAAEEDYPTADDDDFSGYGHMGFDQYDKEYDVP